MKRVLQVLAICAFTLSPMAAEAGKLELMFGHEYITLDVQLSANLSDRVAFTFRSVNRITENISPYTYSDIVLKGNHGFDGIIGAELSPGLGLAPHVGFQFKKVLQKGASSFNFYAYCFVTVWEDAKFKTGLALTHRYSFDELFGVISQVETFNIFDSDYFYTTGNLRFGLTFDNLAIGVALNLEDDSESGFLPSLGCFASMSF